MATGLLKEMAESRPRGARLLGMDISANNIGLAVSDGGQTLASPLRVIHRVKFTKDIEEMRPLIKDYEIGGYVLGYPLNMDGTEGPRCQSIRHFAQEMNNHPDIFGINPWIALWDERLSTATVEDFLIDSVDMSRTKRKQVVDKLAAQFILQGALDYLAR